MILTAALFLIALVSRAPDLAAALGAGLASGICIGFVMGRRSHRPKQFEPNPYAVDSVPDWYVTLPPTTDGVWDRLPVRTVPFRLPEEGDR